ncbi:uncharacterized protein BO66DRAFT_58071 [Aspergillus aculeatinus CBS 121060]|uniref:Uncharacterized protein n=1 Tax=Aspergillus aculeatinus CBS 121060 TaxID=1448322 RepID=A0ACD1HBF8_9EURO|nr:hypothetical protein BO66DRAFT_58071 [Aspergillus aculeatinus CBS 121060]RAH71091.1 hypothetical protein BO66DRAFT_58071 [Aspergillus aculeatinus CBS 121060]
MLFLIVSVLLVNMSTAGPWLHYRRERDWNHGEKEDFDSETKTVIRYVEQSMEGYQDREKSIMSWECQSVTHTPENTPPDRPLCCYSLEGGRSLC